MPRSLTPGTILRPRWRAGLVALAAVAGMTALSMPAVAAGAPGQTPAPGALAPRDQWGYVPVPPMRVLDTRADGVTIDGTNTHTGPLGPGGSMRVPIDQRHPSIGATSAVAINVTGVRPSQGTYLTVEPLRVGGSSSLNLGPGEIAANLVLVPTNAGGISITNYAGSIDVVIDIVGYVRASAAEDFDAVNPLRLVDTRPGEPTFDGRQRGAGRVGPGGRLVVELDRPALSDYGYVEPADVAVLNVTAVRPSAGTFLTVHPGGSLTPVASNLNVVVGQIVPNLVIARVGDDGTVWIDNAFGTVDVVVDLLGFLPAGSNYIPREVPARFADTRPGEPVIDVHDPTDVPIGPQGTFTVPIRGRGDVPAEATAVAVNLTGVRPSAGTFLTAYPTGMPRPNASTLNLPPGAIRPNSAIVPIGADGSITIFNFAGTVDVVVDVVGWFVPSDPILTGAVVDASGHGIGAAAVTVRSTASPFSAAQPGTATATTASDGTFQVDLPAPGAWTLCSTGDPAVHVAACLADPGTSATGYPFPVRSYDLLWARVELARR